MDEQQSQPFDHWCIVELMGHQRIAGRVTEVNLFGSALMRVDVPEVENAPGFSKFFGANAIYAITPVEERVARAMAKSYDQRPVVEWELRRLMLPEPVEDPGNDYEYTEEDEDEIEDDEEDELSDFTDLPDDFDYEPDFTGQNFINPDGDEPVEDIEASHES